MNVSIVISIAAVLIAAVPIYFLAKSNARENERQKKEAVATAVNDAVAPVKRERDDARRERDIANADRDRQARRITELEDKLYGRTQ